jgi:hypothetical protein
VEAKWILHEEREEEEKEVEKSTSSCGLSLPNPVAGYQALEKREAR